MSDNVASPDLLLARRASSGQTDAWEELVDRYGKRIYNVAYQFAGCPAEAEDLTQEIFVRLYQRLRTYRGEVPLVAWALRLSRNLCIDHYRKTRRERSWNRVSEAVLERLPASDDVEANASRRQQVQTVYTVLSELPEELAELVLLHDLQGWTFGETASYLEIPLGTLKSRLHRARRLLTEKVRARLATRRGQAGPATEALSC